MLPLLCTCARLKRSTRIVSAHYDAALAPAGISVAQFSLLRQLQRAGPSTLSDFAAATGFDRTTLNRTLAPLEAKGWVASEQGRDKRSRVVRITDEARAVMRRAAPLWEKAQAEVGAALGEEGAALDAAFDRLEALAA